MKNLTEQVSPIELQKGDRVEAYGALMEVMHIVESGCDVPGGVRPRGRMHRAGGLVDRLVVAQRLQRAAQ